MELRGLRVTKNAYIKKLLLVIYCDTTAETRVTLRTHGWKHRQKYTRMEGRMDGQTDVEFEIVI